MSAEEVSRLKQEVSALQQQAKGANAGEPIYLGSYLLERLAQLGVTVSKTALSLRIVLTKWALMIYIVLMVT